MSSSAPMETRRLAEVLAAKGIALIDAPVSGGVKRALDGSLAIMAGGGATDVERARPLLEAMGKIDLFDRADRLRTRGQGAEQLRLGRRPRGGLRGGDRRRESSAIDPNVLVDVLNASTGRNNSTELKVKPFVLSGTFASAFSMALMAKDLRTAADLAEAARRRGRGRARCGRRCGLTLRRRWARAPTTPKSIDISPQEAASRRRRSNGTHRQRSRRPDGADRQVRDPQGHGQAPDRA